MESYVKVSSLTASLIHVKLRHTNTVPFRREDMIAKPRVIRMVLRRRSDKSETLTRAGRYGFHWSEPHKAFVQLQWTDDAQTQVKVVFCPESRIFPETNRLRGKPIKFIIWWKNDFLLEEFQRIFPDPILQYSEVILALENPEENTEAASATNP
jgi:hypothetical protein